MPLSDPVLSVDEVAELLGLNPQTVRNFIDRGDLAAFRVGRRVRIRQSDLDIFLARAPVEAKTARTREPERSPQEVATRKRLADASRAVAGATQRKNNEPLVMALLELSDAARALAGELSD